MNLSSNKAFTLAEVLITLTIVGVVSAITLPALITNINNRIYASRQQNISQKVSQAMYNMKALGLLNTTYSSTDAFVDELQKHLKIAKRCNAENITDCWPTERVTTSKNKEIEIKDVQKGQDISIFPNKTDNVGLILADGASIILTYDEHSNGVDVGNKNEDATNLIDFVMDVNGAKGPNRENTGSGNFDIRPFRSANFGGCTAKIDGLGCIVDLEYNYECNTAIVGDCYQKAKNACSSLGMKLPKSYNFTSDQMSKLTELGFTQKAWSGSASSLTWNCNGGAGISKGCYGIGKFKAICVEN